MRRAEAPREREWVRVQRAPQSPGDPAQAFISLRAWVLPASSVIESPFLFFFLFHEKVVMAVFSRLL